MIHPMPPVTGPTARMTEIEKKTLASLATFPGEKAVHLADRAGISRSSFSAARKRLAERGVFTEVYVPDFLELGFEILFISYVLFSAAAEANIKRSSWKHVKGRHRHFLTLADGSKLLTMFAARNYTEVVHRTDIFELHYARHGFLEQHRREYLYFPLQLSRIHSFYDFAPLLREGELETDGNAERWMTAAARNMSGQEISGTGAARTGAGQEEPRAHGSVESRGDIHGVAVPELTAGESQILRAMLENPSGRSGRLGAMTGMGRTTADRIVKGLTKRGLVSRKIIVSPAAAGWEYIGAFRLTFRPASTMGERERLTRQVLGLHPVFFIERKKEAFLIFLSRDFRHMNETAAELQRIYDNAGVLEESPASLYFMESGLKYSVWDDFSSNLFNTGDTGHPGISDMRKTNNIKSQIKKTTNKSNNIKSQIKKTTNKSNKRKLK